MKYIDRVLIVLTAFVLLSCDGDWLDEKSDISLVIPQTLDDMRLLLNNVQELNENYLAIGEISSDNVFIDENTWQYLPAEEKAAYTWGPAIFLTPQVSEWYGPYRRIFIANTVLDGLGDIERNGKNANEWDAVKGGALFHRGIAHFELAQLFARPYVYAVESEWCVPLRKGSDIHAPTVRSTIGETYGQILKDLREAAVLLDAHAIIQTDASKAAVYASLSRMYLCMGDYRNSFAYADSCLSVSSILMDYNEIDDGMSGNSFQAFNTETIFYATMPGKTALQIGYVDDSLVETYDENDLRRELFFLEQGDGRHVFQGSYSGSQALFSGITTAEIYLTRAECSARMGDANSALADLSVLLSKRYVNGQFDLPMLESAGELIRFILNERRKELVFRGMRWIDLRRMGETAPPLRRTIDGEHYTLDPLDNRYTYPIPSDIVAMTGIEQNN